MKFLLSFPVFISFLLLFALVALHYQRKRWAYCLIISAIISNYLFATPLMTQIIFVIIGFAINAATEVAVAKMMQFIIDAINHNQRDGRIDSNKSHCYGKCTQAT